MPKLTIDGKEIEVEAGMTVLQACEQAGAEVPRFCYHERLTIAGNCRMCLVEMERAPKPVASCAQPVGEGMVIRTNTDAVKKMRQSVMEFLLINHPLDCPICDQGGECDLQDQAMAYGADHGRYNEEKRAVENKNFGPLINGTMTRCIHCTRCIRFATEIAGVPELGATGRGEHMEVGTYVGRALSSELSGNMIDLCPVGALTSAPYAFTARPWELKKTESIDVTDAVGSNIRIDARGNEVMRVLPRLHEDVNEEWISDKARFSYDGLKRQRLDTPYVRKDGKLAPATWDEAFAAIQIRVAALGGDKIAAIAGDQADVEAMCALKDLMVNLGSPHIDCRQDGAPLDAANRGGYLFNSTIAGIDEADAVLIVGSNPRLEAPIINARLRKRYLKGGVKIAAVGPQADLTYRHEHLGDGLGVLRDIAGGGHPFADVLKGAARPMVIVGQGALARADGAAILALLSALVEKLGVVKDGWNGFNVLHGAAARVGGLDIGFVPAKGGLAAPAIAEAAKSGAIEVLYLLGADEIDMSDLGDVFVVYQGHHGDVGAHRADVILPAAAYTEKNATYVNTEGRVQRTLRAVFPPGEAREDWAIVRALSAVLGKPLPYDNLDQVRRRMTEVNPVFATLDAITPAKWLPLSGEGEVFSDHPLVSCVENFYRTDPISRASITMAKCIDTFLNEDEERTGTHG
ncbi:NADH-quinone oxidoreductase subunit NuoG [Varunaivibrio sulfuroxidans]|uniref:NADH-quinone oxidoreductase n=1 Tax=Varunaivibrio sulfuroxidans TaxID=1773489 RepID=A0A4R3JH71_9PROT|nr:NADH-quinone oxidoreductase subunit NuoG [Varunaivibrio sulfuroxidans]TCS64130.1 NADH dehydrogenase subunit G [Varunaivibrio sulfuroxidans]WES31422.1 NADH-quinone oxidoreductase subunit NuoG [Varunaivibrio sulfuroxidans]